MDLKSLENNRLYILKRLGVLKFLSIIEALLVGFLAFVFTKDILIALILAVFVGIFLFMSILFLYIIIHVRAVRVSIIFHFFDFLFKFPAGFRCFLPGISAQSTLRPAVKEIQFPAITGIRILSLEIQIVVHECHVPFLLLLVHAQLRIFI